jgi:hypothetical protein
VAGEAAASGLRFFLDRGLGSVVVPGALRAAGWLLETMDERYGADRSQNIQDTQWIEEATLAGDVLLCKDLCHGSKPVVWPEAGQACLSARLMHNVDQRTRAGARGHAVCSRPLPVH